MYSVTKVGDKTNSDSIREFTVDTLEDINSLPHITSEGVQQGNDISSHNCVKAGSTAFCIADSSIWMLGNDDVWHQI
jgi:hypothetical protein